jgi:hypothetical protein
VICTEVISVTDVGVAEKVFGRGDPGSCRVRLGFDMPQDCGGEADYWVMKLSFGALEKSGQMKGSVSLGVENWRRGCRSDE